MSDRDLDANLKGTTDKSLAQVPTPEEVKEFKARMARVLERGLIVDRLHVDLPDHLHGEWVANDPAEIHRKELLGFSIDKEYAVKRKLNDKADGSAIIGDVIFMVQPKWQREIFEHERLKHYEAIHGGKKRQKEEADFISQQATLGEEKNTVVASQADVITGAEITQRLTNTQE